MNRQAYELKLLQFWHFDHEILINALYMPTVLHLT